MARMILAAHSLRLAATTGVSAEVLFVKGNCLRKGILQFLVIILTIDSEVGVMVDKVAKDLLRIPANVTGHSGDRDRFAHGLHAGTGFVL